MPQPLDDGKVGFGCGLMYGGVGGLEMTLIDQCLLFVWDTCHYNTVNCSDMLSWIKKQGT